MPFVYAMCFDNKRCTIQLSENCELLWDLVWVCRWGVSTCIYDWSACLSACRSGFVQQLEKSTHTHTVLTLPPRCSQVYRAYVLWNCQVEKTSLKVSSTAIIEYPVPSSVILLLINTWWQEEVWFITWYRFFQPTAPPPPLHQKPKDYLEIQVF